MDVSEENKCIQGLESNEYKNWIHTQSVRTKAWADILCHLMEKDPTELTAIVFNSLDKLQHLFWRFLALQLYKNYTSFQDIHIRELCLSQYRKLDNIIEKIVNLAGENTNVVMSFNQKFGATNEVIYINGLSKNGYLQGSETTQTNGDGKLTRDRMKEQALT